MTDDTTRIQDLTQSMYSGMYVYKEVETEEAEAEENEVYSDPKFDCSIHEAVNEEDHTVQVSKLTLGSHTGTHVDAPRHYFPEGDTIDDFDVEEFRLDAVKVTVDAEADEPFGPNLDAHDLDSGDVVVFETGWDRYWDEDEYDSNPYLSDETARECSAQGYHVAVDTPSPDPAGVSRENVENDLFAHEHLLGEGLFIFENLTNLDAVPDERTFELHAYPLPIVDGDGSPVRAVAVWEE